MRRSLIFAAMMSIAIMAASSCNKEEEEVNINGGPASFSAKIGGIGASTKTYLYSDNNENGYVGWSENDQISVFLSSGNDVNYQYIRDNARSSVTLSRFDGEAPGSSDGYFGLYPYQSDASIATVDSDRVISATVPQTQTATANSFDKNAALQFAKSSDDDKKNLEFKNVCALVKVTVPSGYTVTEITVGSTTAGMAGDVNMRWTSGGLVVTPADTTSEKITSVTMTGTFEGGKDYYLSVIPGVYKSFYVKIKNGDYYYTRKQSSATFTLDRNNLYENISVKDIFPMPVNGELNKVADCFFSVSATEMVRFSKGNLRYQASTKTWEFADNQYTAIGNAAGNNSSSYTSSSTTWIDLFCWASADNPRGRGKEYGPEDSSIQGTSYDWGQKAINNGGNATGLWLTLTKAEWDYILTGRPKANKLYTKGKVNDKKGLILLPDNWDLTAQPLTNPGNATSNFSGDDISSTEWTTWENKGAVFLPVTGYRSSNGEAEITQSANGGLYWTSTNASASNGKKRAVALNVSYYDGHHYCQNVNQYRSYSFAVRLARKYPKVVIEPAN